MVVRGTEAGEESLLRAAVLGDADALSELFRRHGPIIAQSIGKNIPRRWRSLLSAEDVMQQTYADAARGISRFSPRSDGAFPQWLEAIALCNLKDGLRALTVKKRGGDRDHVSLHFQSDDGSFLYSRLISATETPSRPLKRAEAVKQLRRALDQLPSHYRRVIVLYDLEGMSVEQVAGVMQRSVGAVYMLRARALEYLQDSLFETPP